MNKTPRLSKSGIEYLDYVWNFYSGCLHKKMGICPVDNCWAEGIVNRFGDHYPNGFEPTYYPEAFLSPLYLKKPSIIGCAFMGDLFGDWVDPDKKFHSTMPSGKASITMSLRGWIFTTIKQCPQHTFLFLTKNPKQLVNWGNFPDNCWVGVSATAPSQYIAALAGLSEVKCGKKFISFEPLLYQVMMGEGLKNVDWVIIGLQTPFSPKTAPKIEWITEIVEACDKVKVPVFLKNNLYPLLILRDGVEKFWIIDGDKGHLRQELPATLLFGVTLNKGDGAK